LITERTNCQRPTTTANELRCDEAVRLDEKYVKRYNLERTQSGEKKKGKKGMGMLLLFTLKDFVFSVAQRALLSAGFHSRLNGLVEECSSFSEPIEHVAGRFFRGCRRRFATRFISAQSIRLWRWESHPAYLPCRNAQKTTVTHFDHHSRSFTASLQITPLAFEVNHGKKGSRRPGMFRDFKSGGHLGHRTATEIVA
jgi:hypothetical protein